MAKQKVSELERSKLFDPKIMILGDAGSGKTHLVGTYTKGPVHFYMFDPGGQKTLYNQRKGFNKDITIDIFIDSNPRKPKAFTDFWSQIQQDEKDGFFEEMAKQEGIVVFDSVTTISQAIFDLVNKEQGFPSKPDFKFWGKITSYTQEFVRVINAMPCAVFLTAHLKSEKNTDGAVIKLLPTMIGQTSGTAGLYFDEVWHIKTQSGHRVLTFQGSGINPAKSRLFDSIKEDDLTMDMVYEAFHNDGIMPSMKVGAKNAPKAPQSKVLKPGKQD